MNIETAVMSADNFFLYRKGLDCIRFIQSFANPSLTVFMKLVTGLVGEFVFFAVIMILFWLINERKAFRLGLLVLLSLWFSLFVKSLLGQPRPFHFDATLGMAYEPTNGFPSSHSQLILVFLVTLSVWFCRKYRGKILPVRALFVTGAVSLILLVSFSRLYLGVHFPQDILGGWIIGALALVLFFFLEKKDFPSSIKLFNKSNIRLRLAVSALVSIVMNALYPHDMILSAMVLGFAAGYTLLKGYIPFTAEYKTIASAAIRLGIGFAGMAVLYLGLKFVFPSSPSSSWYVFFRFIRYALLAFWASAGAPWVFARLERPKQAKI